MDLGVCPCQVGDPCPIHDRPTPEALSEEERVRAAIVALRALIDEAENTDDNVEEGT